MKLNEDKLKRAEAYFRSGETILGFELLIEIIKSHDEDIARLKLHLESLSGSKIAEDIVVFK